MAAGTGQVLMEEFRLIHGEPTAAPTQAEVASIVAGLDSDDGSVSEAMADDAVLQAAYFKNVHALPRGQSALCLSGGGIRSAAFALGVLQGLARREMLSQFHYLSTVSGGGYIGAWLTAWAHRQAVEGDGRGVTGEASFRYVEECLASRPSHALREMAPFRWLRRNQKFITPRGGFVSADLWAAVALFLRDLLLNWLVYLPAIAAVLLLPRLLEAGLVLWAATGWHGGSAFGWAIQHWYLHPQDKLDPPSWQGWADVAGAVLVLIGMSFSSVYRTSPASAAMTDRKFTLLVLTPILLGALALVTFNGVVLASGVPPDRVLLWEWIVGVPATFALSRILAGLLRTCGRCWRLARGRPAERREPIGWGTTLVSLAVDVICLALSGGLVGLLVWAGLDLHQYAFQGRATLTDLVVFGLPFLLLAFVLGQVAYAGLSSLWVLARRDQEWMARASGFYLLTAVIWLIMSGLVIYGQPLQSQMRLFVISGAAGTFTLAAATSTFSKATAAFSAARERLPVAVLVQLGCLVFLFGVAVAMTAAVERMIWLVHDISLSTEPDRLAGYTQGSFTPGVTYFPPIETTVARAVQLLETIACWVACLLAISFVLSIFVDVNVFSLHALYRNRLTRTFLGATNLKTLTNHDPERNTFDGFSRHDDVPMSELWSAGGTRRREGPFPLVNIALNLVGTKDLALQERKAGPFIATPLRVGSDLVGYMVNDRSSGVRRQLSLGTAMAISGAAASPNWGYHSSALIGFVMMLFNLRLGWWLENPRKAGRHWNPFRSFRLFLQEALGQTTASDRYVYLSDGGHFDNLGVYEMLRRRCRLIVAVDATQDNNYEFSDLGRSLRTAAVDLGVRVDFMPITIRKRTDPASAGVYAGIAQITYPERDWTGGNTATLIYLKPGFFEDAPADVRAYAASNPQFPHDNTFNQWFTESQFESYRALGSHVVDRLCGAERAGLRRVELAELPYRVREYLKSTKQPAKGPAAGAPAPSP